MISMNKKYFLFMHYVFQKTKAKKQNKVRTSKKYFQAEHDLAKDYFHLY